MIPKVLSKGGKCDENGYFSRTRCWLIFLLRTGRHRAEWSTLGYRWGNNSGVKVRGRWRPGSWGMTVMAFSQPIMEGLCSLSCCKQVPCSFIHVFFIQCLLSTYYGPSTMIGVENWMVNSRWNESLLFIPKQWTQLVYLRVEQPASCSPRDWCKCLVLMGF